MKEEECIWCGNKEGHIKECPAAKREELTIFPRKSDFTLHCICGTVTTYGSSFKEDWYEGTEFECRYCGAKYKVNIDIKSEKV